MNEFIAVSDEDFVEMRKQALTTGLSKAQVTLLIRDLERTERERERLAREVESLRSGRMAMRETFVTELHDKTVRIAELEKQLQLAQALVDGAVV